MAYSFRPRPTIRPRLFDLVELRTNGDGVPLKENWNERYVVLEDGFKPLYDQVYNFEVFDDDVFVVTYPKSGTTWMQEAAWLLLNDLDFKTAKQVHLGRRSIFLEPKAIFPNRDLKNLTLAAELKRPRLLKSHLSAQAIPRQMWEKKAKIIYCARNPKDVATSYCPFFNTNEKWKGTLDEFVDDFVEENMLYSPYWPHVLDFWKMRHEPQIFFTTYEDMKRDLGDVLTKLNKFLGKPALNNSQLSELLKHLSFESMKENKNANFNIILEKEFGTKLVDYNFMRRGIIGAYRDELSKDSQRKIDEWTKKCLQDQNVTEEEIFGAEAIA